MNIPDFSDLERLVPTLNRESPRGVVLVSADYLSYLLGNLIKAFIVDSKESDGLLEPSYEPFGSFSSRIRVSFALGLLGVNEFDDLKKINSIRNDFAHSWESINFEQTNVKDSVSKLSGTSDQTIDGNARLHFSVVVAQLVANLKAREKDPRKGKRHIVQNSNYPKIQDGTADMIEGAIS